TSSKRDWSSDVCSSDLMRAELRQSVKQGSGVIVNTASGAGLKATPGLSAYSAAKHGVVGLTRTGAMDYVKSNIRINAVAPGTIQIGRASCRESTTTEKG